MEIDRYEPGVPSWVDMGSPNPQGAADFYGALFGWDAPEGPPETGGYRVAMVGDRAVAGIGPQQNPGPPVWATYVAVDDADGAAAKVAAAGGQSLVPPMDVLDVGRMAVFTDPAGAVFAVWQAGTHPGAQLVNEPGTWSWSELLTTDVEGAKAFYGAVFGWTAHSQGAGPTGEYTEWQVSGRSVGGMMQKPPMLPAEVPPHWAVYFAVSDADAAVSRVAELGGSVMMPPMDIEPGRFAVVADPYGAVFNVIALKPELGDA
jgi:predicted enzyme related to lactoylglutathione lyase